MPLSVLIVDDHAIVRVGLRKIIEAEGDIEVGGEAANGLEAVTLSGEKPFDVIIMDIAMPMTNGIDTIRAICRKQPDAKIVVLSMYDSSEHIYQAFHAGACAYLLKGVAGDEIVTAIRAVMRGETYYGKGVEAPPATRKAAAKGPLDRLGPLEKKILQLLVDGKSSAQIAELLSVAQGTPDVYRTRITKKLGVRSTVDLVKFAIQHGITSLERSPVER